MNELKTILKRLLYLVLTVGFIFSCQIQESEIILTRIEEERVTINGAPIEGHYIVVYKKGAFNTSRISKEYITRQQFMLQKTTDVLSTHKIDRNVIHKLYGNSIQGFSATLSFDQLTELKNDPIIDYIEQDKIIALSPVINKRPDGKPGKGGGGGTPPPQEVPWGISRVNGGADGTGLTAWIIDTGIDLTHPDLNVDVTRSISFLSGKDANDPNDANGHGTHVSGTIAAKNNTEGVVGVAAGATVIAVRVLNRRGSGTTSGVISGIDYVGANGSSGEVANMSLGGGISTALDQAVVNASNGSGVIFALAAGNESDDANNHSPARANGLNIVTVSASDINDNFASFSNFGNPPIDWCAPGVNVKSTWKKGDYNTISGTSMATPHVAGVLLLGPGRNGGNVNGDPDGQPDVIITH